MSTDKSRRPQAAGAGARKSGTNPAVKRALKRGPAYQQSRLVLGRRNYLLMAAGAVAIVIGFFLLDRRETSLSPVLLVLGYCVLIPAALLWEQVPGRAAQGRPGPGGEGE